MFKKIVGLGFSTKGKNARDAEKYIAGLVEGGANEFFTGYNPSYWSDKFGYEVSPNGRFAEHEQITDFETLEVIVGEVHKYNLEVFINLNAWYYTPETMPLIEQMVEEFKKVGVDGIICGNIGILEYLKSINYEGKINISTIMALYNKEAVRFFLENYKVNKVILSREVTLKEIEAIVTEFPETNFEVFGEGDFCRYNNGLCFAEHKYSTRDICTVVVNDLIIKKRYNPAFKKIALDETLSNIEKAELLKDEYSDIFDEIASILGKLDLGFLDTEELLKDLYKIVNNSKSRIDLFFDAMQPINSKKNINILTYLRGLKRLTSSQPSPLEEKELIDLRKLQEEIEASVKSGIQYNANKIKELGGAAKLKAMEIGTFYAKGDNLNLYSYLFFSKFKNIETVKFPTRGRNYTQKITLIQNVLNDGKVDEKYLDRGISLERAHYDLTYLFGEKNWFREMVKEF